MVMAVMELMEVPTVTTMVPKAKLDSPMPTVEPWLPVKVVLLVNTRLKLPKLDPTTIANRFSLDTTVTKLSLSVML